MKKFSLYLLLVFVSFTAVAQNYTILGNASPITGCNCYRLTPDANDQAGAIFQNQTLDLTNSFDFTFNVFLGCNNGNDAADGIVFVLTNNPNGLGSGGGGLGYGGNNQPFSLGVEFDTYENGNVGDPSYDHIGIESAGNTNHNVAGAVPALTNSGNIDNCQWYSVRIVWNVNTGTYSVYFNGVLRQSVSMPNMVNTYFGGNPIVNWGWTAGTGGGTNDQQVCVLNTSSWVTGVNYQSCSTTMQFSDISTSSLGSIQSWAWNFGDGTTSTLQNPTHTYAANGTYTVTLIITDISGCTNTFSHPVTINAPITLSATTNNPLCNGGSNGGISLVPSGGFGPSAGYGGYMYTWNNGTTQSSLVGATAGTYTVSVTDGVCTTTAQYTINQPSALSATTSHTDAPCAGNGSATINISGGTPPYSGVNWAGFPGSTVSLPAGTWIADFHDANGCSALLQYTETIASLPCGITSSVTTVNVSCFGGNNGSATLTVTGGVAPINISWSSGATGATATNLAAGTYTYNYSDGNPAHAFSGTVTITQPGAAMSATLATVDMSCAASNDGQAIVSVGSGGVPPYNYTWSGGQPNNPAASNLSAGAITVTVTDSRSCTATATGTITGPPTLTASVTTVNDSCYQGNKGNATVNVSGGNAPYTFYWSNISSAQTNLNLGAGTYTVTVTDNKNCTVTGTATITEPSAFTHTLASQNINCFGQSTGSINVTASGGSPTYTYTWNPATASGSNPTSLPAGVYNVTVQDSKGCQILDSANITQPSAALTVTTSHTNVTCNGLSNGTVTVNISGGTAPYTYLGNPIPTGTTTVPNLPANTYAGNVVDNKGCSVAVSETITEPTALSVTETHTNVACNGASSGAIDITVSGGTTPYTFSWNGGITTEDRTALPAGSYSVTVTDLNLCTATLSVTISQPTALALSETHTNILCNGNSTGAIDLSVSGGTTTYSYNWGGGVTTEDRTAIAAGTYTVTLTDFNSCTSTLTVTISQPTALIVTTSHTNVTCNGLSNGTVTVNISGGTTPYTYLGNPIPSGTTTVPNLPANTYAGNVVDGNGCSVAVSETITEPTALSVTETHTNVACNGASSGAIDITVSGGTTPYTFSWNGGVTTEDRTALPAGSYSVTVTDLNLCTATLSVTISQPTALALSETHTNILCNGNSTGAIDLTVSGGTTTYSYNWGGGVTTEDRTAIASGTYTVTVTDFNACTSTLSVTISQPTALTVTTSHTNVTCNGLSNGTVTVNISGGTTPYTYLGNPIPSGTTTVPNLPANTYAGNVVDGSGCSVAVSETITEPGPQSITVSGTNNPCFGATQGTATANFVNPTGTVTYNWTGGLSGANISNLAAGTFTVTATDQNSCTLTGSYTVTQPAAPIMTVTTIDATCFGGNGSATANPSGGNAPFNYTWSFGGSGQTIAAPAGTNTVTATDASTCQQTATFIINQPADIIIAETHTNVNCFGDATGDISLTPSGGTGPNYTYNWNPNVSANNLASLLTAGAYNITVTDQASCQKTIVVTITEPAQALSMNIQSTNITCFGLNNGSISVTATGGTPAYSYTWSPNVGSGSSAQNLSANTYSITVSDANSCSVVSAVTITEPSQPLTLTPASTNLTCYQSNDGVASVSATGGTFPYVYVWTPNVSSGNSANGLAAGNYNVTVTDDNGCTANSVFNLTEPAQLTASETHVDVLCHGDLTGSVTITAAGGNGTYTYNWNPNVSTTNAATALAAGNYQVTVLDINGCSVTIASAVSEPAALSATAVATDALCNGGSTGTITTSVTGGSPNYNYSASPDGVNFVSSPNGQFNNLAAGIYTVLVVDQNSCAVSTTATVSEPTIITNLITEIPATCYQYADGQLVVTTSGGNPGYTFSLSNGTTNNTGVLTGLAAGTYTLTVTDATGCTITETGTITEPDSVTVSITPNPTEVKLGETLQLTATANQSGNVTYTWSPNFGLSCYDCPQPLFDGVYSQQYTVVATTDAGCFGTSVVPVTVIPNYDIFIPNAFTPNGDGQNDTWQLFGNMSSMKQADVKVFNRWGEKVFESNDLNFQWDGTYKGEKVYPGVYTYVAKFVWINNHSDNNYKGSITVLF